jgi:hypothetical protein
MQAQAQLSTRVRHGADLLQRPDPASGAVVRVLDRHDPRARGVQVLERVCGCPDLLRGEPATVSRQWAREESAVRRRPAELGHEDVGVLLGKHLVPRLAVESQRNLVRHRRGRDEDGLVVAQELRNPALEEVDRGILALLFVTDLGRSDRGTHRRRRPCRRVGAKVDHARFPAASIGSAPCSSSSSRSSSLPF